MTTRVKPPSAIPEDDADSEEAASAAAARRVVGAHAVSNRCRGGAETNPQEVDKDVPRGPSDHHSHPRESRLRTFKDAVVRPSIPSCLREDFRCHDCETHKRTGTRRPATLPRANWFNVVVGIDTKKMPSLSRQDKHHLLSMVCWGVKLAIIEVGTQGRVRAKGGTDECLSTVKRIRRRPWKTGQPSGTMSKAASLSPYQRVIGTTPRHVCLECDER